MEAEELFCSMKLKNKFFHKLSTSDVKMSEESAEIKCILWGVSQHHHLRTLDIFSPVWVYKCQANGLGELDFYDHNRQNHKQSHRENKPPISLIIKT